MTKSDKIYFLKRYCFNNNCGRNCDDCIIQNSCHKYLHKVLTYTDNIDEKTIEILYDEFIRGSTMEPKTNVQNTQAQSTQTITLDRSEYNMLIKAQGLLDVVRTSYKTASADYRLCEFLDILFADKEGSNG